MENRRPYKEHDRLARPLPGDDGAVLGGLGHELGPPGVVNMNRRAAGPHGAGQLALSKASGQRPQHFVELCKALELRARRYGH